MPGLLKSVRSFKDLGQISIDILLLSEAQIQWYSGDRSGSVHQNRNWRPRLGYQVGQILLGGWKLIVCVSITHRNSPPTDSMKVIGPISKFRLSKTSAKGFFFLIFGQQLLFLTVYRQHVAFFLSSFLNVIYPFCFIKDNSILPSFTLPITYYPLVLTFWTVTMKIQILSQAETVIVTVSVTLKATNLLSPSHHIYTLPSSIAPMPSHTNTHIHTNYDQGKTPALFG